MTKTEQEKILKDNALHRLNLELNLNNPTTIQEKIVWLMINDEPEINILKGKCADKILIHEYCKEKLGEDICIPILKTYNDPNEINFKVLPNKFVLKTNHGYAMNIIVDKSKNEYKTLKKYNIKNENDCKKQLKQWLDEDFGKTTGQLHYSLINPKCFAEQYMESGSNGLVDYKVWCCNGEPKMIQVISDRYTNNLHANIYDTNWNWFDLGWNDFKQDKEHLDPRPKNLDKMLEYSRKLSEDFRFVRVDFYIINDKLYLGELTFSPDSGIFKYKDKETDLYWGKQLNLKVPKDKIIVSFTSWKKRIKYCKHSFELMLSQTIRPTKIVLNLSSDEFPNKENDLPSDLNSFLCENKDVCEIFWVKENTKVWKKFIPTLDRYPNDVIIPIDDDIEYPNNYIEEMYNGYLKYNGECPIVSFLNIRENNVLSHSGPFSLVKKEFFGKYLNDIYNNLILKHKEIHWQSDEVYSYAIWLNGRRYKSINTIDAKKLYSSSAVNKIDAYSNYSNGFASLMTNIRKLLQEYIKTKYNKNYDDLFKGEIIVNFTTWKGRDKAVPKMLEHFSKQTLKPNKIICWLSEEEYENVIPEHLNVCKKRGLLSEIKFVKGNNTFAHKRWETLKENNGKYNIMIDDDIYYDVNYVKDLYNSALKNQGCANIWCSDIDEFIGAEHRTDRTTKIMKSKKLQVLSGLSCYPPYTLPYTIFENEELRDTYCKKCDDSWIRSFIIKEKIDIVRVYERKEKSFKVIEDTQDNGIWETENKKVNSYGIEKLHENLANAIIVNNAVSEAKEIWPKFDVYKYCDIKLGNTNKLLKQVKTEDNKFIHVETIYNIIPSIETKLKRRRSLVKKKETIDKNALLPIMYQL